MAYRNLARFSNKTQGPTAPRKRFVSFDEPPKLETFSSQNKHHPLTDIRQNEELEKYELEVKGRFDRIVPLLRKISSLQHDEDFISRANQLTFRELGFELPEHILEKAWVRPLDMRALFAWCVFQSHQLVSAEFFNSDPLNGGEESMEARKFQNFLKECGFHLLDITPCSDGRLAHSIAYALRIPFSAVRRRSHAGALFDVERTVNRWIKTEHKRFRESKPNSPTEPTRYLKVVTYHFSSVDPTHQGCAAHGSDEKVAAQAGLQRLLDFREAIENSFCCGASVDLLLVGIDTDNDSLRIHVPSGKNETDLTQWISTCDLFDKTYKLTSREAISVIEKEIKSKSSSTSQSGMESFLLKMIINNFSQIDYVLKMHRGTYPDAGHAERFIGVGIGFKEIHLRNLTYFAHLDTVEEGAPDLDVGIKIFKGLNISRDLPIPIVIRFDYSGRVPGERDRAIADCKRVDNAISERYRGLVDNGQLHTLLTIRDRDKKAPAVIVGSSLDPVLMEAH